MDFENYILFDITYFIFRIVYKFNRSNSNLLLNIIRRSSIYHQLYWTSSYRSWVWFQRDRQRGWMIHPCSEQVSSPAKGPCQEPWSWKMSKDVESEWRRVESRDGNLYPKVNELTYRMEVTRSVNTFRCSLFFPKLSRSKSRHEHNRSKATSPKTKRTSPPRVKKLGTRLVMKSHLNSPNTWNGLSV